MSNAHPYRNQPYINRIVDAFEQAQMRDEYHAMEERVAELEAERDRLREAMEKMLDPEKAGVVTYEIGVMQDIARAAIAKVRG